MRLRQSNSSKRFRPSDLNPDLGDSGDEHHASLPPDGELSDGGSVHHAASDPSEDDFDMDQGRISDPESLHREHQPARHARRQVRPAVQKPASRPSRTTKTSLLALSETREYPTDSNAKWTRTYPGVIRKWATFSDLSTVWFGDRQNYVDLLSRFTELWWDYHMLPPKLRSSEQRMVASEAWMPAGFWKDQSARYQKWHHNFLAGGHNCQTSTPVDKDQAYQRFLPCEERKLVLLSGHPMNLKETQLDQSDGMPVSAATNHPRPGDEDVHDPSNGWVIDVGGTVVSMGWAPLHGQSSQFLAMSVIPFADQAFHQDLDRSPMATGQEESAIQIWKFGFEADKSGLCRARNQKPILSQSLCATWGRVSRLQWCPVPRTPEDGVGMLAALYSDGSLRIFDVQPSGNEDSETVFEEIEQAAITLDPPQEHGVMISSFTWINMNRIAVGHTDGSVCLWSLLPCRVLQRHGVFSSSITDMSSAYPSHPFILMASPMGGVLTMIDLSRPNAERGYNANLSISLQPNLLSWNEHLRGWISTYPSAFAGTSNICLTALRRSAQARHVSSFENPATCIAVGSCHPYVLTGTLDGSVWAINAMRRVLSNRQKLWRLKILQHEYRELTQNPYEDTDAVMRSEANLEIPRGASRILHGFRPLINRHPKDDQVANDKQKTKGKKEKGKAKKRKSEVEGNVDDSDDENMEGPQGMPVTVEEPKTRITFLTWNPNAEFGWWAAVAMGSGLVRVIDLGIEELSSEIGMYNEAHSDMSFDEDDE